MKTCRKGIHQYEDSRRQCPECTKPRKRAYSKAYREAHREQILEQRRAHYQANRDQLLKDKRAAYWNNRAKMIQREQNRRDRAVLARAWQDPSTLRVIFASDQKARKLIALAFDRGATESEKEVAIAKLKARRRPDLCQPTPTTCEGMQSKPLALASLST